MTTFFYLLNCIFSYYLYSSLLFGGFSCSWTFCLLFFYVVSILLSFQYVCKSSDSFRFLSSLRIFYLFSYLSGTIFYGKGSLLRFLYLPYHWHIELLSLSCPMESSLLSSRFHPLINVMSLLDLIVTLWVLLVNFFLEIYPVFLFFLLYPLIVWIFKHFLIDRWLLFCLLF